MACSYIDSQGASSKRRLCLHDDASVEHFENDQDNFLFRVTTALVKGYHT